MIGPCGTKTAIIAAILAATLAVAGMVHAGSTPIRARNGMVVSQNAVGARVGMEVLKEGGNAIDAAVATAFAMAVTHPTAGNIGGGGFIVFRPTEGEPIVYDFREMAPAKASADMWLKDGEYDRERHHMSHLSVGVPGTVAGLHLAWKEQGSLPWKRLVVPAIALARDGFAVTDGLARSLERVMPRFEKHPASMASVHEKRRALQDGRHLETARLWRRPWRASLTSGPAGFYEGETAELIEKEMKAGGGLITKEDLKNYQPKKRKPVRGTYRGYEILSMPPPSSGGTVLVEMLNILEGFDLAGSGFGSAQNLHLMAEAMRRGLPTERGISAIPTSTRICLSKS